MIVAIDGPAGSGKSTVARAVAQRLGFEYLDTGAMYRAVTWLALERGLHMEDEEAVASLARAGEVRFGRRSGGPSAIVSIAGIDVTEAIRTPLIDETVSIVAREPAVRAAMVAQQRRCADEAADVVVEGRDIGTVVFPDAALKVYLTASAEARAHRRHEEHREAGHGHGEEFVLEQMERRDRIDSTRAASPLAVADDAVEIDTTSLTPDEVVERIVALVHERGA